MKVDDYYSFKNPGSVPFKWEIRPGVPKIQIHDHHHHHHSPINIPNIKPKLKLPPARLPFHPQTEAQPNSFGSTSTRNKRLARPDVVSLGGCLPSNFVKAKIEKRIANPPARSQLEYSSDNEIPSRWSISSRRSVSPLSSSSFASFQSSPRPVSDAEWAAFGLF